METGKVEKGRGENVKVPVLRGVPAAITEHPTGEREIMTGGNGTGEARLAGAEARAEAKTEHLEAIRKDSRGRKVTAVVRNTAQVRAGAKVVVAVQVRRR